MTLRKALEAVRDKMQAAAYHRNYRQACIDANEIVLDALVTPPSEEAPELRDSIQRELDSGWAVSEVLRRHGFRLNMPVTSDD